MGKTISINRHEAAGNEKMLRTLVVAFIKGIKKSIVLHDLTNEHDLNQKYSKVF